MSPASYQTAPPRAEIRFCGFSRQVTKRQSFNSASETAPPRAEIRFCGFSRQVTKRQSFNSASETAPPRAEIRFCGFSRQVTKRQSLNSASDPAPRFVSAASVAKTKSQSSTLRRERETGLEPETPTLARLCSTN